MRIDFNRIFYRVAVCILFIPLLLAMFLVANLVHIKIRMYHLQHADHARILAACREMIAKRNTYHNDMDKWGTLDRDDVLLLPPLPNDLPDAIHELNPHSVIIRNDYVMLNLGLPFCRIGLLGFKSGARQFGTFKYMDGLWFWNGDKGSEVKNLQASGSISP